MTNKLFIHKLEYFKSGTGLCADDFNNKKESININIKYLLSYTNIKDFNLPLSGKYVGKYAFVKMKNNDIYYINEESYNKLNKFINIIKDEIIPAKIL